MLNIYVLIHFYSLSDLYHNLFGDCREDRDNGGCFWSRDPPRPPPRDHTAVVVDYIYIIYIEAVLWVVGWVVEWGHETKTSHSSPDPRDYYNWLEVGC